MFKRLCFYSISCLLVLSGCAHLPVKTVSHEEAQILVDDFGSKLAPKFEVLSSVVFKFHFFSMSSLGLTSVDLPEDRLSVAGVSPFGITLFKVSAVKGEITQSFVVPELAKRGDVAKAISGNIHDIYFDLVPREFISQEIRGDRLYVKSPLLAGAQTAYVFSEIDRNLMEKRLYKNGKLFWTIYYSGWSLDDAGNVYPKSIRLVHRAYGYQLLLNVKEMRPL